MISQRQSQYNTVCGFCFFNIKTHLHRKGTPPYIMFGCHRAALIRYFADCCSILPTRVTQNLSKKLFFLLT